ncbi:MAG: bifunctional DNA primase/polymerase [Candidatus Competibacteraceae bacterium]|nr:bifunctional DNA primase/polymerase [Candidatus Competibacteraceae bacterium]
MNAEQTALLNAALDYVNRGMALTWFDYGQKFPQHLGWNTPAKVITTPEQARAQWGNGQLFNIGLVHGLGVVKTCSLDVDQVDWTRAALAEFGIDLNAWRAAAPCVQGNPANFRLEYRQPPGRDLPLVKLQWPDPVDPKKKVVVFELRAGANQDVLPPSKHPNGQNYIWLNPLPENPADHPEPPSALLELWRNWASWEKELQVVCPWATPAKPKTTARPKEARAYVDVIGKFNQASDVRAILETHGYQPKGKNRYLPPNSTSGVPSVRILGADKVFSDNGSCPLNDGHAHDAFDCYRILAHGGDWTTALKAVTEQLGIELPQRPAKRKTGPNLEPDEPRIDRPATVRVNVGELPEAADETEAALIRHGAPLYQRSGYLCRITRLMSMTVRGITRPQGAVAILPLDTDHLLDRMARLIQFEKWSDKKGDYIRCHAPTAVAKTLLARSGEWRFPVLNGVVSAPTLRPDGSLLDKPGYDPATGLLFEPQGVVFPVIPEQPTRQHAQTALAFLFDEVLSGFPFAAAHDRSAALSAILTALIRPMLKSAPLHGVDAPLAGTGKSLLADGVSLIATGSSATIMAFTSDPDEMRKRLLSVLLQGDAVINLDNVQEPIQGDALCSVLTQETFTDRLLGVNRTATAPTCCTWLATGNSLQVIGDMTRRLVRIQLDSGIERPEEREFQRNLYDWIPMNRPALVNAGLTVLRAYIVAGKPKQPIKTLGSFEEWSDLVRSALVWLGEADPCLGRQEIEDADPARMKLRSLLLAWFATFKSAGATGKEAVAKANETRINDEGDEERCYPGLWEILNDHFQDRGGNVRPQLIGEFVKKNIRRVEIGARFEGSEYGTRMMWRVVITDQNRFQKFSSEVKQGAQGAQGAKPDFAPLHPVHPFSHRPENFGSEKPGKPEHWSIEISTAKPDLSFSPVATDILNLLRGSPGGFSQEEIVRQVGNGKGRSPALIELALTRLAKEGAIGRVNGKWVAQKEARP